MENNTVTIPLTKGRVALVDARYAHIVRRYKWRSNHGYAARTDYSGGMQKCIQMHRYLWEVVNGSIPEGMEIDHKNRIKTDNHIENLRLVTHGENQRNKSKIRSSTASSEYVGVSWDKFNQKWRAWIQVNGTRRSLGCFNSEELASEAYQKACAELASVKKEA